MTSQQLSRSVPVCILHVPLGHVLPVAEIEEILHLRQEARRPASKALKLLLSQRPVDSCSDFEYIKVIQKHWKNVGKTLEKHWKNIGKTFRGKIT